MRSYIMYNELADMFSECDYTRTQDGIDKRFSDRFKKSVYFFDALP